MDTSKLPEARIERERYVLAVFSNGARIYYNGSLLPTQWCTEIKDVIKYATQQEALKAIESYGQKYYNNSFTRNWEIWLIAESRPISPDWVADSEQQII